MGGPSTVNAIVIGAIPYSDSSKIVKILTREWGVVPVFVRMGSGKKGGARKALWHPFASVQITDLKGKTQAL
jgi:recombinational DNA repair protein (RecF pathway)